MTCIDVGAHEGEFTALLTNIFPAVQVHAFEPSPHSFALLESRHHGTRGVILNQAGVSDAEGSMPLHSFDNSTLNSFLPLTRDGQTKLGSPTLTATAPLAARLLRLDAYTAQSQINQIDLLKIDTQGYELRVLRGAEPLFAAGHIRAVLLEINFAPLYEGQARPHELFAFLEMYNFQLVEFYEKCRQPPFIAWCTALFKLRPAD